MIIAETLGREEGRKRTAEIEVLRNAHNVGN